MIKTIKNKIYGRLHVDKLQYIDTKRRKYYLCTCECGKRVIVQKSHLISGDTKSCGCLCKDVAKLKFTKHGKSNHPLSDVWNMMKQRCYNKNNKSYKNYGARGIKVCDEWKNNFKTFYDWAMENGYQDNLTIDRINVNGNYEPLNCKWVTQKQQQNNRTNNIRITYNGKTDTLSNWSICVGVSYNTLYKRICILKWSVEKAFNTKVRGRK